MHKEQLTEFGKHNLLPNIFPLLLIYIKTHLRSSSTKIHDSGQDFPNFP